MGVSVGNAPDAAVAQIDDDLGVDLLAVVGRANEVGTGLEEEVGVGRLRENGLRALERVEYESEKEQSDDGEQEVGGAEGFHSWLLWFVESLSVEKQIPPLRAVRFDRDDSSTSWDLGIGRL